MAYTTKAKVRNLFNNQITTTELDNPVLDELIANADNIINDSLRNIYSVPFSPVPGIIETISTFLSAAFVIGTLYNRSAVTNVESENDYYDKGIGLLEKIQEGKIKLKTGSIIEYEIKTLTGITLEDWIKIDDAKNILYQSDIVTDTAETVTYYNENNFEVLQGEEIADYKINYSEGYIYFFSSGSVTAGSDIKIKYKLQNTNRIRAYII